MSKYLSVYGLICLRNYERLAVLSKSGMDTSSDMFVTRALEM